MLYKSKKIKFISINEFNKHLAFCKSSRYIKYEPRKIPGEYLEANLVVDRVNIYLTYRNLGETVTYSTRLDGEDPTNKITGLLAYQTLCKYYKVPNVSDKEWMDKHVEQIGNKNSIWWNIAASSPLLYSNMELGGHEYENCYSYDMTSAYGWALTQPIPDTSVEPKLYADVGPNEIGFFANGEITFEGHANIVFPLMESPFKRFVNKWFGIKKYGNEQESIKAKQMLNYAVGYMQRTNPFIRNTVVERCNRLILSFIDKDTLYCNTDSIVSKKARNDIPLGVSLGEFHIEHRGTFAYVGFNYQWNHQVPTYRGVAKNWFKNFEKKHKRHWSILTDELPTEEESEYYYDYDKVKILRRK